MAVELRQTMARTGRRPGPTSTRGAILDAARRHFAETGYAATSLRTIAADAGVDPTVLLHFFGSKDGLFRAVVGWPFDPAEVEQHLAAHCDERPGARLARTFFHYWEHPNSGPALAALTRSAMTHAESAALLRDFVGRELFGRVAGLVSGADAQLRIQTAVGQLIGVAMLRYVLRLEPIASMDTGELIKRLEQALEADLQSAVSV
jgi:AcrR family transcriptional regulator